MAGTNSQGGSIVKKTVLAALALLSVVGFSFSDASAQGMLGKGYIDIGLGQFLAGDDAVRNTDDGVMILGIEANYPVLKNLDVTISGSYNKLEGAPVDEQDVITIKTREVWAGATVHFQPDTALDPFVKVSVGYVGEDRANPYQDEGKFRSYIDTFGKDGKDNFFGFGITAGVDVPFAGQFAARPAVAYRLVDDVDDFGAQVDFNGWFNKNFFAVLSIAYWAEDGDLTYMESLGYAF